MAGETVKIIINGEEHTCAASATILEACRDNGIDIPTLCYHARLQALGRCKVCVVETLLEGEKISTFKLSCSTKVSPGMRIWTTTPAVRAEQRAAAALLVSKQRPAETVAAAELCEFERMTTSLGDVFVDDSSLSLVRDMANCVDCGRCVIACRELQGMAILNHSVDPNAPNPIDTQMGLPLDETDCISCGQCAAFCPTEAISERDDTAQVLEVIRAGKLTPVVSFAPSTRVAISEEFGLPAGTISTGKMVAALRAIGFKHVFDTDFAADLTIMEEGHELLHRVQNNGVLPMFTSCCPGWVDMVEKLYPQLIPHLSTCKSPQQMQGACIKAYWAKKVGLKPEEIYSVSIMPCTAKKRECAKNASMSSSGARDVDIVLTTRELGKLLRALKIPFDSLEDSIADHPLGDSTGAAVIFGASGGVMEAALRTVYEKVTGERLAAVEFEAVRGLAGIKEATVNVGDLPVSVAVANGGKSCRELTEHIIANGMTGYHFVEMMACPGGCIGGGGQPRSLDGEVLMKRMRGIYSADDLSTIRRSHDSPDVIRIYKDYLKAPLGRRSHKLLHTSYTAVVTRAHQMEAGGTRLTYPERIVIPSGVAVAKGGSVVPGDGVTVVYATNTGTAAEAAEKIRTELTEKGIRVNMARMSDYIPEDIEAEELIIFVAATMGAGDFTEDARPMWAHLSRKDLPNDYLSNVKFAVFGLGSSGYEAFCASAGKFDERMNQLGGRRILACAMGDEMATEKYLEALEPFIEELPELVPRILLESSVRPPYRVIRSHAKAEDFIPPRMSKAKITENRIITPDGYEREVRFIKIDLEGSGLSYHAGDHIGILPFNTDANTSAFLDIMGLDGKQMITIRPVGKSHPLPVPGSLTVFDLVKKHLDIYGRPTRAFFQKLAEYTADEAQREAIAKLGTKVHFRAFYNGGGRFVDVFEKYASARPPIGALIDMVPFMKDRLYSIASAPSLCGNVVELVVVLDRFNTTEHGWRSGITTSYLWELAVNEPTFVRLEHGNISLPEDPSLPITLCGLGTGIAPMRSLLQHRMYQLTQGIKLGPAVLYYSVRHHDKDYFFADEWKKMMEAGALTELIPIFSHDTPPKLVFVQDTMKADPRPLWDNLGDNPGYFFFCGPAAGVPQYVQEATERAFVAVGSMTPEQAAARIEELKGLGRYVIESCGGLNAAKPAAK